LAQLGFLGLGIMGYPMAGHLLKAGHDVALWTNQSRKAQELAKTGNGTACAHPREVAERADYIFYCVGDTRMARGVTTGKNGLIEGVRKGAVISDCSTISPVVSREIGTAFAEKGAHFLDSPVTGSVPGAEKAALTFMIGGDKNQYDRAKPFMEIMGKMFYYCGAAGQGLLAKLTQNLVGASIMQAFAEGMVLAVKNGIAPELMFDILDNSAAKSGLAAFKTPYILNRDFSPKFSTKWMHKDVGLALESAQALDLPLPLTAITHQMLRAAIAKGWGDEDFVSIIRVLEDWAGVVVRKS
jgi:3-hydroxyisobutyrate dehydrogenase-like beta-hydroxyacid dehydrogenase